jgi:hypothetical protein
MPQVGKEIAHLVVDPSKKWSNEFLEDPNAAIQKYNPKFFLLFSYC